MSPLALRIGLGLEDDRLLDHIHRLQDMASGRDASAGITDTERAMLLYAWERLDIITSPS